MPRRKEPGTLAGKRRHDNDDVLSTPSKRRRVPARKLKDIAGDEEAYVRSALNLNSSRRDVDVETANSEEDEDAEGQQDGDEGEVEEVEEAPPKRKRGRPPKNATAPAAQTPTKRKSLMETPTKANGANGTTPRRRAADRSARKKSARALIQSVINDGSDPEQDELAREIYESNSASSEGGSGEEETEPPSGPTTPSKTPRRVGRPRKQKSPTPPRDLPPHELYFFHNRPGRVKTSDNTLSSLELLTHEEYFSLLREHEDPHEADLEFLQSLHMDSFPQWEFELSQDFTVVLYGLGSKRPIVHKFAGYMHNRHPRNKIIILNGHVRTITAREILNTISSALDPKSKPGSQPATIYSAITTYLSNHATNLTLLVSSIDAAPLRRPALQSLLAQLASHPNISLLCTADTPDFSLLWDVSLRSSLSPLFHDATTLMPLTELDVVDDVHELLGRAARRAGGREAVAFVLKSLTQNARSLYSLLIAEVLTAMDEDGGGEGDGGENPGIEYRMLYNKAVEAFVCPSSEMAFRQLLREFHDHQMITSRKDNVGTELLSVPFTKEEMEAILEDIES